MAVGADDLEFLSKYIPSIASALTIAMGVWVKSIHTRMIKAELKIEKLEGYKDVICRLSDKFDALQKELGNMHTDVRVLATILRERENKENK